MKGSVTHKVRLREGTLEKDGELIYNGGGELPFHEMIRTAYRTIGGKDRKFYRMDELCKIGVLCSELLMQASGLSNGYRKDRIGVVLANSASSLDSDRLHQASVNAPKELPPSPSVFVHTLPNIVIGEICIRHGITGENAFFIFEDFSPDPLVERVDSLIRNGRVDACIAGWCEKDGEEYEGFFYTVEKRGRDALSPSWEHRKERILELYR